jgi:hypothetical protein
VLTKCMHGNKFKLQVTTLKTIESRNLYYSFNGKSVIAKQPLSINENNYII